jgi:ferredoxin
LARRRDRSGKSRECAVPAAKFPALDVTDRGYELPGIATASPAGSGAGRPRFDLLRLPVIGRFLRWRWSRLALQAPVLLLALVMIAHAFFGPDLAPKNLATLLTWVHFRGLVVLVLLFGGNFFCMACPFMLPRELARRWISPRWRWPRWLRHKGPAIVLFVGVLFVYEWLDLWSDPWATGLLIVGYFAAAFTVDLVFKRASFCKYVCPIGQFNFLASTLSPLEVAVRNPDACASCRTKDCLAGHRDAAGGAVVQRGCELDLFLPRKTGNLDCTFCLDCVHACPHDNIGLLARLPGEELAVAGPRSSIGDLDRRTGWTLLVVVFVFGAVLNAFAMISPVYVLEQAIARATGLTSEWPLLGALFTLALVVEPVVLLGGAALLTRRVAAEPTGLGTLINRFARSLVPLGFGVWLAHYGFHFLTGALTVVPVAQNAARAAAGREILGAPRWQWAGLPPGAVLPIELCFLALGLVGTLLVGWRLATQFAPQRPARAWWPWAVVALLLAATAGWTLLQPMDMRGTFVAS